MRGLKSRTLTSIAEICFQQCTQSRKLHLEDCTIIRPKLRFLYPICCDKQRGVLEERAALPDWWQEDLARKDVLFVSNGMDKSAIVDFINESEFHNEIVHLGRNAIFWGKYDEAEYLKSTYHKQLTKQAFYKYITIRNGKTYEKIADILEGKG